MVRGNGCGHGKRERGCVDMAMGSRCGHGKGKWLCRYDKGSGYLDMARGSVMLT